MNESVVSYEYYPLLFIMRMNKTLIAGAIALACSLPIAVSAARLIVGEQPSLPVGTIAEDIYLFGGNITSSADITGDLVAAGGNMLVNGSISQDAALGGGSITMLASVGDDLRIGGGNVTVAGSVAGDLIAGGGNVQVTGPGIGGDMLWGGGALTIDAPVAGDLTLGGGEVYINSTIGGSITFTGEKLTFGPSARVEGTVSYTTPKEAEIAEGAVIVGAITHTPTKKGGAPAAGASILSLGLLLALFARFIAAYAIGRFFSRLAHSLVEGAYAGVFGNVGRGTLMLIALPIVSVLLMITVVGLPLGFVGLVVFTATMLFSWILMPLVLGSLVYQWFTKREYEVNWKTILIGVLVNALLGFVPFVGWIVQCGFMLLTIGALVQLKWNMMREWR